MLNIPLLKLSDGFSTNPAQPVRSVGDTFTVPEGQPTLVDPVTNDSHLVTRSLSLVSVSSPVNCAVTAVGNLVSVTGTSAGAGSFSYVVSDGVSTASGTVSLTINLVTLNVVIADDTHTDFGTELSIGDTLYYSVVTAITGAAIAVDTMGHVSITGTYQTGDSFTYRVNAGTLQTFTFA